MALKLQSVILLLALCLLLFFWGLGDIPFYTRGEPREGLVVSAMYTTGNWILPKVRGSGIPFKPPLFHWVAVLAATILGNTGEFALRFPSAIFGTFGVLFTYIAGARLWGEKSGLISAVVLATSPEWWEGATLAQVDMTLSFFISAALLWFILLYRRGKWGIEKSIGLALLLALATLAKGPAGVLLPLLAIAGFLWLQRDLAFLKRLHPWVSPVLFLLVAGSWYALAAWQGGKAFFIRQLVEENLQTAVGMYGHYQPPYYFVPAIFLNAAPWSAFFPSLAFWLYKERRRLAAEKLLYPLVWFVTIFLFFSLARGKRAIYLLPLYPAAALLLGAWWQELEKEQAGAPWLARAAGYLIAGFSVLLCGAFFTCLWREDFLGAVGIPQIAAKYANAARILHSLFPPSPLVWTCFALLGMAALVLMLALSKKTWNYVFVSLMVSAVSVALVIERAYFPYLANERTLKPFMERVSETIDPGASLFFYRAFDYGVIFYARRHIAPFQKNGAVFHQPFFLLMWEEEWQQLAGQEGLDRQDISEGTGPAGRHHMVLVKVNGAVRFPEFSSHPILDDSPEGPLPMGLWATGHRYLWLPGSSPVSPKRPFSTL